MEEKKKRTYKRKVVKTSAPETDTATSQAEAEQTKKNNNGNQTTLGIFIGHIFLDIDNDIIIKQPKLNASLV